MLAIVVAWVIITFVFLSLGTVALSLYERLARTSGRDTFLDIFFIGMAVTGTLIGICSLFVPADITLLSCLVGLSAISLYFTRQRWQSLCSCYYNAIDKIALYHKLVLFASFILFIIFSIIHPQWIDSLFYHIQNVMWNEEYSVVPGLANLQPRFGFNSNYFLLCSTFGLKSLFGQFIYGVHILCTAYVFCWILYKALHCDSVLKSIISLLMICSFLLVYKTHITSPSTDLLPNLLILYIACKILFDRTSLLKQPFLFVVLIAFCITLKLSCSTIALLIIYIFWKQYQDKQYKVIALLMIAGLLIGIPWCIRTVILTGYLIFPYASIDIFDFDWKIPVTYVQDQKDFIMAFARVDNKPMEETLRMTITEWLPQWWNSGMFYHTGASNRVFFFLMLLSVPSFVLMYAFSKKLRKKTNHTYIILWLTLLISVLIWFLNAPDFRFAYGSIISLIFLSFFLILDPIKGIPNKKYERYIRLSGFIIAFLFLFQLTGRWAYYQKDDRYSFLQLMYKPQSVDSAIYTREKNEKIKVEFVATDINRMQINQTTLGYGEIFCYDCPLPCSPQYVGGIEMRGTSFHDGFRCAPDAPHRITY